jgi:hypothetical protein
VTKERIAFDAREFGHPRQKGFTEIAMCVTCRLWQQRGVARYRRAGRFFSGATRLLRAVNLWLGQDDAEMAARLWDAGTGKEAASNRMQVLPVPWQRQDYLRQQASHLTDFHGVSASQLAVSSVLRSGW